jgi:predicted Fe-S protein YdhL (DUF1289 family)
MKKIISPCQQTCLLDRAKECCAVCGRTSWEIANWTSITHTQRKEIIKRLNNKKENANELGRSY